MSGAFSEYVVLLDDVEHIPLAESLSFDRRVELWE
jgi:hypothetical protein